MSKRLEEATEIIKSIYADCDSELWEEVESIDDGQRISVSMTALDMKAIRRFIQGIDRITVDTKLQDIDDHLLAGGIPFLYLQLTVESTVGDYLDLYESSTGESREFSSIWKLTQVQGKPETCGDLIFEDGDWSFALGSSRKWAKEPVDTESGKSIMRLYERYRPTLQMLNEEGADLYVTIEFFAYVENAFDAQCQNVSFKELT